MASSNPATNTCTTNIGLNPSILPSFSPEHQNLSKSKSKQSQLPDPPIRTLKVEILTDNSTRYVPVIPNSREPTPFETEFFKGIAMIMVRTAPIDTHFDAFFNGRKRMFEVQVQGQFKRDPIGEIYVGAGTPTKMEIGLLTRSIGVATMKFASTMVTDMHYSFGESVDNPNHQLPHVVGPCFNTFDKIVVTKKGSIPPPLGIPFVEDPEYRKSRLKFKSIKDADVDLDSIYSFSVNTSNLNLLDWTMVGIPMVKPMDLRTFFGNAPILLVGYEVQRSVISKFPNSHPHKLLSYVFSMRLSPVEPDSASLVDLPISSDDDLTYTADIPDHLKTSEIGDPEEEAEIQHDESDIDDESDLEEVDEGVDTDVSRVDFEPENSNKAIVEKTKNHMSKSVGNWLRKKFGKKPKFSSLEDSLDASLEVNESSDYNTPDYSCESVGDLNFCLGVIELNDSKKEVRSRYYYMLPIHRSLCGGSSSPNDPSFSIYESMMPRLRSFSDINKALTFVPIPKMHKNNRLSELEKRRRQITESYKSLVDSDSASLKRKFFNYLSGTTDQEKNFLGGNTPIIERINKEGGTLWEGHIALALSRRHFVEQYMLLNKDGIIIKRSIESRKVGLSISISNIVSVQSVPLDNCPFSGLGFFQIETFARVFYVLVRSDIQLNEWLQAFLTILGKSCFVSKFRLGFDNSGSTEKAVATCDVDRDDFYLARPACWRLDKRRVYNYRRILFMSSPSKDVIAINPNTLIASILENAFNLSSLMQSENNRISDFDWVKFWDEISLLQTIDLSGLNESERISFFLNLYHTMIIHGSLVFGPPPAWNHWNAFFNQISYIVSFELLSIAEVEYCILRAGMSRSSLFTAVAMPAPPSTIFPSLAVGTKDFRFHFAINCGSYSLFREVPIYSPEFLDVQLDEITRITLEHCLEIDFMKRIIVIPKLPIPDYCSENGGIAKNGTSATNCLHALLPYLSKQNKMGLLQLLQDSQHLTVRYRNLNFKCRMLAKFS